MDRDIDGVENTGVLSTIKPKFRLSLVNRLIFREVTNGQLQSPCLLWCTEIPLDINQKQTVTYQQNAYSQPQSMASDMRNVETKAEEWRRKCLDVSTLSSSLQFWQVKSSKIFSLTAIQWTFSVSLCDRRHSQPRQCWLLTNACWAHVRTINRMRRHNRP